MILLQPIDLVLAAGLVLCLALLTGLLRLGVAQRLLINGGRMVVQLLLVGLVLKQLFASSSLLLVLLLATIMLLIAGYEIRARQRHRPKGAASYSTGLIALLLSGFTTAFFGLAVILQPDPWYQPQYAIPLLGMLFGNSMNAVALTLDRLYSSAHNERLAIEAQLILGSSGQKALETIRRMALRTGLIPLINTMAAAGIVSLPGMMTGQILAGTPPIEAVKYQIMIWLLIAASAGFGALIAVTLGSRTLIDPRHRLRLDQIEKLQ